MTPAFLTVAATSPAYRTVFDIAKAGYKSLGFPAFGLIFVALGLLLVTFRRRLPGWSRRSRALRLIVPFGYLGFAVLWTAGSFVVTYGHYRAAAQARADGTALIAEGLVTQFVPVPVSGHAMERFCVAGACFSYSDYVITAGFNQTRSHGGPIHEGLPVRVTYVGNTILKLEIAAAPP